MIVSGGRDGDWHTGGEATTRRHIRFRPRQCLLNVTVEARARERDDGTTRHTASSDGRRVDVQVIAQHGGGRHIRVSS